MLDIDIRHAGQRAAVVVVTRCTALLRGLRGIGRRVVADIVNMAMAVEVVRRMTIGAIARCGARQLRRVVMANITVVMLDVVGRIHKVRVLHRRTVTAATTSGLRDLGRMIFDVVRPVTGYTAVALATVVDSDADRAVGTMARGTGVMLLIIRRVDEVLTRGQRCRMTACTRAVQGHIAGRRMINVMIRPVATRMTGRTDIRTAFMAHRRADQGVGARIVTGGAAVMHLGIVRIGEGGRRIDVTDQTIGFTGHVTGTDVIHAMIG